MRQMSKLGRKKPLGPHSCKTMKKLSFTQFKQSFALVYADPRHAWCWVFQLGSMKATPFFPKLIGPSIHNVRCMCTPSPISSSSLGENRRHAWRNYKRKSQPHRRAQVRPDCLAGQVRLEGR
jgi:hypothetical protein